MGSVPIFSGVKIDGLRELRNAMRSAEAGSQKTIQRHLKAVAIDIAAHVAERVPQWSGSKATTNPYPPGSAKASVRAYATTESAYIRGGGNSAPYFPWLDFGGTTGKGHKDGRGGGSIVRDPFMGTEGLGRYVYQTIHDEGDTILQSVMEALDEAELEAGWERA